MNALLSQLFSNIAELSASFARIGEMLRDGCEPAPAPAPEIEQFAEVDGVTHV
jgi:hypothetical protein